MLSHVIILKKKYDQSFVWTTLIQCKLSVTSHYSIFKPTRCRFTQFVRRGADNRNLIYHRFGFCQMTSRTFFYFFCLFHAFWPFLPFFHVLSMISEGENDFTGKSAKFQKNHTGKPTLSNFLTMDTRDTILILLAASTEGIWIRLYL